MLRKSFLISLLITFAPFWASAVDNKAVDDKWSLVWADEFDGDALDLKKWSVEDDCWGGGNEERQCYTKDPKNVSVQGGQLVISARKEKTRGFANTRSARSGEVPLVGGTKRYQKVKRPFSSGRIVTRNKGDWKYGRIEARMKLPTGQGLWPAFWMLPTDYALVQDDKFKPWVEKYANDENLFFICPFDNFSNLNSSRKMTIIILLSSFFLILTL